MIHELVLNIIGLFCADGGSNSRPHPVTSSRGSGACTFTFHTAFYAPLAPIANPGKRNHFGSDGRRQLVA